MSFKPSARRLTLRAKRLFAPRYILPRGLALSQGRPRQVLVASVPRCGSTLLFRAVAGHPPGRHFPRGNKDCQFITSLDNIPDTPFLKTHSPAPEELPNDLRVIFIFGNPIQAVWSTWEKRFKRRHFEICGYRGEEPPDILHRDDLGYERIFDSWMQIQSPQVARIRYERLWENKHLIEEFIGRPIVLPPHRTRQTDVPAETRRLLATTYASLCEKSELARDFSVG